MDSNRWPVGRQRLLPRPYHLAFICLILAGLASVSPVGAAPIPIADYRQMVRETRQLLDSLPSLPVEDQQAQLTAVITQWESLTEVILPDGTIVPVDHSFLLAHLRADPPNLPLLQGLFASLADAQHSWPAPRHNEADVAALQQILTQSEFQWPPQQPSLLEEWGLWLWLKLFELLARFAPETNLAVGPWAGRILTVLGVLTLLLVLAYFLRGMLGDLISEAEIDVSGLANEENLTADTALKRARELSGGGDYRTAVRYLYLSSLLLLDERGLLRYDRSQTNREYLRSVAHRPELATILQEIIDVFDRVWYGYQPLDEAAYTLYAARIDKLRHVDKMTSRPDNRATPENSEGVVR